MSFYGHSSRVWWYCTGTTGGSLSMNRGSYEQRCNCSIKYGPGSDITSNNIYVALCSTNGYGGSDDYDQWIATNTYTCPRGWGKFKERYPSDSYSVRNGQGYCKSDLMEPVYGYVTRYRNVYYNYIAGRVSKA